MQARLEEVLLELARWLHARTGDRVLTMAGGVALNCVANSRLAAEGPFEEIWVQPAAGDAGTALGGALQAAADAGERAAPMPGAALGRGWTDEELAAWLDTARWPYERPADLADEVAQVLAADGVVGWFAGRSEYGPRALGHRSLLANPGRRETLARLNDVKGREQFRPVAPMVRLDRAADVFDGPLPSPYMLFVHRVRREWVDRIPAVVHVDGTARAQTVDPATEPEVAALLAAFERRTGLPCLVNTSLNTAGRPMVDDPRDALELFGSAPVDVLVLGPYLVRRPPAGPAVTGRLLGGGPDGRPAEPRARCCGALARRDRTGAGGGRRGGRPAGASRTPPLDLPDCPALQVVRSGGRGPAAARNAGWRATATPWVAFLDDDVLPPAGLGRRRLAADLAGLPASVAGLAGPAAGAAAGGPAADRLGARHRRAGRRPLGDRGHGVPAGGAGAGRRLRRAVPPGVPGGRRAGAAAAGRRLHAGPRGPRGDAPGAAGVPLGDRCGPSAATRTTR